LLLRLSFEQHRIHAVPLEFLSALVGGRLAFFLIVGFHTAVLSGLLGFCPAFFIWLERKVSARIQDRLGPTRVGGRFGWAQSLADGIKLIQKEDLAPAASDRAMFQIAPYIVVAAAFSSLMVLPFTRGVVAVPSELGAFLILAILSPGVVGVVLAGYASGSKWSLFGAMREAAQMVSYEIPLALAMLVPLLTVGSLDFMQVVELQAGFAGMQWLVFANPFNFLAFIVFLTVSLASVKRAPFDLAEAESELVAGFLTEYSGIRWSYFFLAEYTHMFTVSAIAVLLFLGGWWTGLGIETWLDPVGPGDGWSVVTLLLAFLGLGVFLLKCSLLVILQMLIRWTLPRLRIDQVMTTCLKYLLPISCVLLLGAATWPLVLASLTGRTTLIGPPLGDTIKRPAAQLRAKLKPDIPAVVNSRAHELAPQTLQVGGVR
jgi:NADH-quinone oxidoreductase subunit H